MNRGYAIPLANVLLLNGPSQSAAPMLRTRRTNRASSSPASPIAWIGKPLLSQRLATATVSQSVRHPRPSRNGAGLWMTRASPVSAERRRVAIDAHVTHAALGIGT